MASVLSSRAEPLRRTLPAWPRRPFLWVVAAIMALGVAASALAVEGYQSVVRRGEDEARLRAEGGAADVDRYVQSRWWTLQAIASATEMRDADVQGIRRLLSAIDAPALGLDAGISWLDAAGWMRVRTGGYTGPPIDFSARQHIAEALRTRQPAISDGIVGTVNQAPIVAFVVPVFDDRHVFSGLLGSGLRLDRLSVGADSIRYAGGIDLTVLDRQGQVIAGATPVRTLGPADPRFPIDRLTAQGRGAERLAAGTTGAPDRLVGYAVSPTTGWLVVVERAADETYGSAGRTLAVQLLALWLGVLLSIGLIAWVSHRLRRALQAHAAALAAERATREELQAALRVLEEHQQLRDAFVGVMSHELRTPVTTIYGAAKLLVAAPDRPELRSLLEDIEAEAERLRRITEDLLVLSRAEHALLQVVPEPLRILPIVASAVADVRRHHPEASITIVSGAGLPPVTAEAGYLRQIVDNLLGNAVKYGGGTPVIVRVEQQGADVRLSIEDGGRGLSPEEHDRVFELFYRSPSNQATASGTGIGLFVVRQLAIAMGGSCHVESVEPHGLRVVVILRTDPAWRVVTDEVSTVVAAPASMADVPGLVRG